MVDRSALVGGPVYLTLLGHTGPLYERIRIYIYDDNKSSHFHFRWGHRFAPIAPNENIYYNFLQMKMSYFDCFCSETAI